MFAFPLFVAAGESLPEGFGDIPNMDVFAEQIEQKAPQVKGAVGTAPVPVAQESVPVVLPTQSEVPAQSEVPVTTNQQPIQASQYQLDAKTPPVETAPTQVNVQPGVQFQQQQSALTTAPGVAQQQIPTGQLPTPSGSEVQPAYQYPMQQDPAVFQQVFDAGAQPTYGVPQLQTAPTSPAISEVPVVLPPEVSSKQPTSEQPKTQLPPAPKAEEEAEKIKEDKPSIPAAVPSELKGIDTLEVDDPGGNWLVKRMWWEKADKKMDRIEEEVDKVMSARMAFFKKRDKADSEMFDPFYGEIGFDQGQLEEIVAYMVDELKDHREKYERLGRQERDFLKKIKEEKKTLDGLKIDINSIKELDNSLDDALTGLVKQINLARTYKKEARELFKKIGRVLDHDKARQLYYEMDAAWQSIKSVVVYISGKFTQHFEQIINQSKQQIDSVKAAMDKLEAAGKGFKEQLKKMKKKEALDQKEAAKREKLEREREEIEEYLEGGPGFIGSVISTVMSPIYAVWNWITSWFKTESVTEEEEVSSPQQPLSPKVEVVPQLEESVSEQMYEEQQPSAQPVEPQAVTEKVEEPKVSQEMIEQAKPAVPSASVEIAPVPEQKQPEVPEQPVVPEQEVQAEMKAVTKKIISDVTQGKVEQQKSEHLIDSTGKLVPLSEQKK